MRRAGAPYAIVPLCDSFSRRHAKEQSTTRINVMIFEVDALQPRIVPRYSFGFDECFQQPFLCNPINPANKRLSIMRHFFFFNDTATTEIYTLSLHDALPI